MRFNHLRKATAVSLAVSSCAFFLFVNQGQSHADAINQEPAVVQATSTQSTSTASSVAASTTAHKQNTSSQVNMNDQGNYAWLDSARVENQSGGGTPALTVNGWHATNQAINKPSHYIILLDRTTNRELGRQKVQPIARPDVAKAYPGVQNANEAGFSASFALSSGVKLTDQLQVISRYTSSADGNSDYLDYWFAPLTTTAPANQGYLDNYDYTDGQHLTFSGWHATDLSPYETNHFAILYDLTANSQVAAVTTTTVKRADVARAFPKIKGADNSGFRGFFNLQNTPLIPGHQYSIVSRYSTSNAGNGGDGQYIDYWSPAFSFGQSTAHYIDSVKMASDGLTVSGWMVADQSLSQSHPFIIVLENGHEIARRALTLTKRADVAKVYPKTYNSLNSGFSTKVSLNPQQLTGQLQLILRFTDDPAGNGHFTDQYSPVYQTAAGWFDQIAINGNTMTVSGWHASDQSVGKNYQYLIFLDQDNHELYRQAITNKNLPRQDVGKAYPAIFNSDRSGYQVQFTMPAAINHQLVRVIHRITDDPAGNGNYVDYTSDLVPINVMRTPIDYRQSSEYAPYPDLSKLNNFWIHVRIGQNRVYLMNGNDVVYTMYCTAGTYSNGVSATPTGTYYIQAERGNSFYNAGLGEGANYWTSFLDHGVYLFHSVPTDASGNYKSYEASQLGINQGSHGCIRLSVPDAYWFMHNVPTGTRVVIDN